MALNSEVKEKSRDEPQWICAEKQRRVKEESRFAAELRRIVLQSNCIELNGIGKEQPRTENAMNCNAMEPKCGAKATVNGNRKEKLCRVD